MNLVDKMLGGPQTPFDYGLLGVASQIGNPQGNAAAGLLQGQGAFQQSQLNRSRMGQLQQEAAMQRAQMAQQAEQKRQLDAVIKDWEASGDPKLMQAARLARVNPSLLFQVPGLFQPEKPQMEVINGRIMERDQNGNWVEKANIPPQQTREPGSTMNAGDLMLAAKRARELGLSDEQMRKYGLPVPEGQYLTSDQLEEYSGFQRMNELVSAGEDILDNSGTSGAAFPGVQHWNDMMNQWSGYAEIAKRYGRAEEAANWAQDTFQSLKQPGVVEWRMQMGMLEMQIRELFTPEKRMSDKDREFLMSQTQLLHKGTSPADARRALETIKRQYRLALEGRLGKEIPKEWSDAYDARNRMAGGRSSLGVAASNSERKKALRSKLDAMGVD